MRLQSKIEMPDHMVEHNAADRSKYGLKDSNTGENAV